MVWVWGEPLSPEHHFSFDNNSDTVPTGTQAKLARKLETQATIQMVIRYTNNTNVIFHLMDIFDNTIQD